MDHGVHMLTGQQFSQRGGFEQMQPVIREPADVMFVSTRQVVDDRYAVSEPM